MPRGKDDAKATRHMVTRVNAVRDRAGITTLKALRQHLITVVGEGDTRIPSYQAMSKYHGYRKSPISYLDLLSEVFAGFREADFGYLARGKYELSSRSTEPASGIEDTEWERWQSDSDRLEQERGHLQHTKTRFLGPLLRASGWDFEDVVGKLRWRAGRSMLDDPTPVGIMLSSEDMEDIFQQLVESDRMFDEFLATAWITANSLVAKEFGQSMKTMEVFPEGDIESPTLVQQWRFFDHMSSALLSLIPDYGSAAAVIQGADDA